MKTISKEEIIAKAYGEHWETVKDYVDENGWCRNRKIAGFYNKLIGKENHPKINYWFRPLSLHGIENNNGWIKIVENGSNLPNDENFNYKACKLFDDGIWELMKGELDAKRVSEYYNHNLITHYQPIVKPKPPLY